MSEIQKYLMLAFSISRIRFWLYLGGTYLIGYTAGVSSREDFLTWTFWLHLLYFMIPANIFLYGVNDLFDEETDTLNEKKGTKEHLLRMDERERLLKLVFGLFLLTVLYVFYQPDLVSSFIFALFVFLSYYYSAPPIRFKSRPLLDFSSNVLYVLPGLLGYYHVSEILPRWEIVFGLFCWTGAMHLFSAVPDIEADKQARVQTTAVYYGKDLALYICFFLWSVFAFCMVRYSGLGSSIMLSLIYPFIILYIWSFPQVPLTKVYWWFPYINGFLGFALFWYLVFNKQLVPFF